MASGSSARPSRNSLGCGWLLHEELPVPVFLQIRLGEGGRGGEQGGVEFGGPKQAVQHEQALVGIGPVGVQVAAGEAKAASAVGAFVGPGDGLGAAGVGLGIGGLAAAVGHGAGEHGHGALGQVQVVEPAVLQQLKGLHALGGGMRGDGVKFHIPMAAAADVGLEGGAKPLLESLRAVGRAVDALVQDGQAGAGGGERLHFGPAFGCEEGQLFAAIHEEQHGGRAIEHGLVVRPALRDHHGGHTGHGGQPVAQQGAAGEVFVLPGLVAGRAGDEHDARGGAACGRHLLQRHLLLLGREVSVQLRGEGEAAKPAGEVGGGEHALPSTLSPGPGSQAILGAPIFSMASCSGEGAGSVSVLHLTHASGEVQEPRGGGEGPRDEGRPEQPWQVEHEPEDRRELGEGGDLAGPVGLDLAASHEVVDEEGTADAGEIAEDDEGGEPEWEMLTPSGEAERDDGGEQHELIRQGV